MKGKNVFFRHLSSFEQQIEIHNENKYVNCIKISKWNCEKFHVVQFLYQHVKSLFVVCRSHSRFVHRVHCTCHRHSLCISMWQSYFNFNCNQNGYSSAHIEYFFISSISVNRMLEKMSVNALENMLFIIYSTFVIDLFESIWVRDERKRNKKSKKVCIPFIQLFICAIQTFANHFVQKKLLRLESIYHVYSSDPSQNEKCEKENQKKKENKMCLHLIASNSWKFHNLNVQTY